MEYLATCIAFDHNFSRVYFSTSIAGRKNPPFGRQTDRWPMPSFPPAHLTPFSLSPFRSAEMLGPVLDALTNAYKKYEE